LEYYSFISYSFKQVYLSPNSSTEDVIDYLQMKYVHDSRLWKETFIIIQKEEISGKMLFIY